MPFVSTCFLFAVLFFAQSARDEVADHASRAQAAQKAGDYKTAIAEYRHLRELVSDNPRLDTNFGIALYLDGQFTAALPQFQAAARRAPELFAPRLFLGLSLFRLGRLKESEAQLLAAARINPLDPLPHLWLGYIHAAQERYPAAVAEFRIVLSIQPANADALYTLGKTYLELGRSTIVELLQAAPTGGRAWQLAGDQCRLRGEREAALRFYKGAAERRPDIEGLPVTLDALERYAPSPPAIGRGLAPKSVLSDEFYAKVLECEKHAQETLALLGRLAPDSDRALEVQADALVAQGRNDEAMRAYRLVLEKNARLPEVYTAIGSINLREGKAIEAAAAFQRALALQPFSAVANVQLARALLVTGQDDRARQLLQTAAKLDHPPVGVFKMQGKIYLRRQQYKQAAAVLETYTDRMPLDSGAHYLLARAYRALGQTASAKRESSLYRKFSLDARTRMAAARTLAQRGASEASFADDGNENEPEQLLQ